MSGTSYGACILHISPEAAVGGPLAFVRTGDMIEVDVAARQLNLLVSEDEMARRKSGWKQKPLPPRGYNRLVASHIQQAHDGCDFDFLLGTEPLPEPEIH
jgi:dihydroxyacid dehydratase/phosphogluconate dehydratase